MQNLNDLLRHLSHSPIDFVVVGGFAAVIHGATYVTRDLDLCFLFNEKNILELRRVLKDAHPIHRMNPSFQPSFLNYPEDLQQLNNLYLKTDFGIVDFISEVEGVGDYNQVLKGAETFQLFGEAIKVISLEDLIKCKRALNRPKDKLVLEELLEIQQLKQS